MGIIEKLEQFRDELNERLKRIESYLIDHMDEDSPEFKDSDVYKRLCLLHREKLYIVWYLDCLDWRIRLEKRIKEEKQNG